MLFGNTPLLSRANCFKARTTCLPLDKSFVCLARSCTALNAGRAMLARIAMIAITTSSSLRVNAEEAFLIIEVTCWCVVSMDLTEAQTLFLLIFWARDLVAIGLNRLFENPTSGDKL